MSICYTRKHYLWFLSKGKSSQLGDLSLGLGKSFDRRIREGKAYPLYPYLYHFYDKKDCLWVEEMDELEIARNYLIFGVAKGEVKPEGEGSSGEELGESPRPILAKRKSFHARPKLSLLPQNKMFFNPSSSFPKIHLNESKKK